MFYLGICAIIKDEDQYLDEWLAYYTALGAETFYLYDNESDIPLAQSLAHYMTARPADSFRVHMIPGAEQQMRAYNHCLAAYRHECRWMAFVDMDEFIVPLEKDSIPEMLVPYERYAGLALNWKTFGTNGHETTPSGLQMERYTRALPHESPMNRHVKLLVDPARYKGFHNPHFGDTAAPGHIVVDDHERPVDSAFVYPPVWRTGQINHYFYRSREAYAKKLRKPRADTNTLRPYGGGKIIAPEGELEDAPILRFVPRVKKIIRRMRGTL